MIQNKLKSYVKTLEGLIVLISISAERLNFSIFYSLNPCSSFI